MFDDDDLYARFTFDNFKAEWMLVADSLRYELAGKELRLQDPDGSVQTHQIVTLTDSTLTLKVGDIVERWRRPQASDPGY